MTYAKAKSIITQGVITKNADLLILEKATIQDITKAYEVARTEIAKELKEAWNTYAQNFETMTAAQKELAQIQFMRSAKLYENLETRISQLGGKVDKINSMAILEASGISNEFVKNELETLAFFTNLDPQNFARINTVQAEIMANKVNQGTKFVSEAQRAEVLPQLRQQIRIGILKGESIDRITDRIVSKTALTLEGVNKGVFSSIEARAKLNARWGIIESSSAAAVTQYGAFNQRCQDADIKVQVKKQVIAQVDERTTVCCIYANGQIQEIDKPFDTEQGSFDYTPFHCNCRSTVAAWHELFEQFGKSTKQMHEDSKKEIQRRNSIQAKKNQGKLFSPKQQELMKAKVIQGQQAMFATEQTIPEVITEPITQKTQEMMGNLYADDANRILQLKTEPERQKAIREAEDKVLEKAKIFKMEVESGQTNLRLSMDPDAIAKRDILKQRISVEATGKARLELLQKYMKMEIPDNMELGQSWLNASKLCEGQKAPATLKNLENLKVINKTATGEWTKEQEFKNFTKWIENAVNENTIKKAGRLTEVEIKNSVRGYYSPTSKKITVQLSDGFDTFMHEYGHHLQDQNAALNKIVKAFYQERIKGQKLTRIYEGYEEFGYKDKFFNHYCGRVYKDAYGKNIYGQEILSMGLEKMSFSANRFYEMDPDYFRLVLGFMSGIY